MKQIIIIFILLLIVAGTAQAGEFYPQLVTLSALAATDYYQTCHLIYQHRGEYGEANPMLGEFPSRRKLARFGFAGIGAAWAASEILPEKTAAWVLNGSIILEGLNVLRNARLMKNRTHLLPSAPVIALAWTWRF